LGTDHKTPLSEAGATTPERSQKTQQRSKVARTRLIVGGLAVLALVVGGVFVATRSGGDGGFLGGVIGDGDDRPVPEVTLALTGSAFDATSAEADNAKQAATAEQVSGAVKGTLETMLQTAYVDPDTWDDPGAVADSFTGDASDRIESDIAVLTLGADAGDTYEFVDPGKGKVAVDVLTGSEGEALRAFAAVTFPGLAEHDDGTYTKVLITGSYFLVHEDGTWRIVEYRVSRDERAAKPPASPSASPSTSEESSS
jgi:hypothetical protein